MHFLVSCLKRLLNRLSADISLDSPIMASCGTGVTACILALVTKLLYIRIHSFTVVIW